MNAKELIGKMEDVWLRAWQRELGNEAALEPGEQLELHRLRIEVESIGWQPIETAPLGEKVLIYQDGDVWSQRVNKSVIQEPGVSHWMYIPNCRS